MNNQIANIQQAQQKQPKPSLVQVVQRMQPEIERALPKHLDADRMARLALTVMRQSQMAKEKGITRTSLMDATPESFVGSLLTAAALGLEPGTSGEAYLVPYLDRKADVVECQLIIGYQGMVKLFWQHPLAKHIDAQAVYENDRFDYSYGLEPRLDHRPALGDRGNVVAYYAVASLTTGAKTFVVLSTDEIKALRRGQVGSNGNIPDPQHWMERKTALRQLLKMMPKSTQLQYAINADEQPGSTLAQQQIAAQIAEHPQIEATTGEIQEPQPEDWPTVAEVQQ